MNSDRSLVRPGVVLLISVLAGGWLVQRGVEADEPGSADSRIFDQVVSLVRATYVDPVEDETLYQSAIEGLLEDLGDPNSSYLEAPDAENLSIRTEGEYGGVGLEIIERDSYVTVLNPMPNTPGQRAGIRAGDRIVVVDGDSIVGAGADAGRRQVAREARDRRRCADRTSGRRHTDPVPPGTGGDPRLIRTVPHRGRAGDRVRARGRSSPSRPRGRCVRRSTLLGDRI